MRGTARRIIQAPNNRPTRVDGECQDRGAGSMAVISTRLTRTPSFPSDQLSALRTSSASTTRDARAAPRSMAPTRSRNVESVSSFMTRM